MKSGLTRKETPYQMNHEGQSEKPNWLVDILTRYGFESGLRDGDVKIHTAPDVLYKVTKQAEPFMTSGGESPHARMAGFDVEIIMDEKLQWQMIISAPGFTSTTMTCNFMKEI